MVLLFRTVIQKHCVLNVGNNAFGKKCRILFFCHEKVLVDDMR